MRSVSLHRSCHLPCTEKVDVPDEDGVPVINPVALMFRPAGSDPPTILNEIGNCPPELVT